MRCVCAAFALLLTAAATAGAQENTASRGPLFMLASASPARAPVVVEAGRVAALRRRVSLSLDGVQLTDALAEIARAAGLQIVFADGVVPATARVHLRAEEITVAAALTDVLLDARVDVVLLPGGSVVLIKRGTWAGGSVAGHVTDARTGHGVPGARVSLQGASLGAVTNDSGGFRIANVPAGSYTLTVRRIGYAQGVRTTTVTADQEVVLDVRLEVSASPLDAVVVTGTVSAAEQKELSSPITVVTSADIERRGIEKVNDLFRGEIPGVFAADYGASNHYYGAPVYVRGTTELFNAPALKTYVDGIELANSQYLNEIDPAMIDHVEIIRGPEASTLYGAQAINGVMQVFTKKGSLATPPHLKTSLGVGTLEGRYATGVRQEDNVTLAGGTTGVSYNVGATFEHEGAWTPGRYFDTYSGYGTLSIRPPQSPFQVDVMSRLGRVRGRPRGNEALSRAVMDGTLQPQAAVFAVPIDNMYSLPQETFGVSARYTARPAWQHTLTLGLDRGAEGNDAVNPPSYQGPGDSLSTVYSTRTTRATAAYNSALDLRVAERVSANLIVGADYFDYRHKSSTGHPGALTDTDRRDHNTGVFSQARIGFADALFLTAGVRVDHGPDLPDDQHHRSTSPRVGASYVFDAGPVRAKLRAGYGSSLKPASPSYKEFHQYAPDYVQLASPNLLPVRQTGWDAGVEVYAGDRASLSITRYRQIARDLIVDTYGFNAGVSTVQFLNVARARNSGWELEGSVRLLPALTARVTYSTVESMVDSLGPNDQTGYQVGQSLPGVPHHTGALTVTERTSRLSVETGLSYVGTSVNNDQGGSFQAFFPRLGTPNYNSVLTTLPGAYRVGLRASYELTPRITLVARGENLTNQRVYDQGFIPTDLLGRTTFFGVRLR